MKYTKPELALLADARVAIQQGNNDGTKGGTVADNITPPTGLTSNAAYEADE